MTNEVIGDSSDFQSAKKQPRWPKIMASVDLCFTCSKPVAVDAVRCAHNRLLYHRKCLRVQSEARCTICVNASQTVSVPMMAVSSCTTGKKAHFSFDIYLLAIHLHRNSQLPRPHQHAPLTKVSDSLV
ncbi:unnamed protein product [Dicrocoelium dendriticum]|nr:unnamed protein product [Dicrocoelium dendriticum]